MNHKDIAIKELARVLTDNSQPAEGRGIPWVQGDPHISLPIDAVIILDTGDNTYLMNYGPIHAYAGVIRYLVLK